MATGTATGAKSMCVWHPFPISAYQHTHNTDSFTSFDTTGASSTSYPYLPPRHPPNRNRHAPGPEVWYPSSGHTSTNNTRMANESHIGDTSARRPSLRRLS
eukprot:3852797-Prymnesium_polylepis.1